MEKKSMTPMPHKILLLRPPEPRGASFAQFYTLHEALGIGYLASYLRSHGCAAEIFDAHIEGWDVNKTIESLESKDIDILGLSIISPLVLPQSFQIAQAIKAIKKNIHIMIGGQHPTFFYESILKKHPAIDTVIRFEGEVTLLELIERIDLPAEWEQIEGIAFRKGDKVLATPPRALISDLDSLPFPARDTLPKLLEKGGLPLLLSSRGCPSDCSFCSVHAFYKIPKGKLCRQRSPENVVREIKQLVTDYGCDKLWFVDENFLGTGTTGRKRVREIFQGLKKERIQLKGIDFSCRADGIAADPEIVDLAVGHGAKLIYIGVEAGVQRILDLYNKRTTVEQNKLAIKIVSESGAKNKMEFIFFNPWITFDEVRETILFLEDVKEYDPYILTSILTIMRNTQLGNRIEMGQIEIMSPPAEQLTGFDQDAFIPYQIADARARMVFEIVSKALVQFEPVLYVLSKITQLIQKKQMYLTAEDAAKLKEVVEDYTKLVNETSLDIFKKTLKMVEDETGQFYEDTLKMFKEDLVIKVSRFASLLLGFIETQEKELLNGIKKTS
jgi:radical SAM superfamily enzyme YgiQ (UPF0313 family)